MFTCHKDILSWWWKEEMKIKLSHFVFCKQTWNILEISINSSSETFHETLSSHTWPTCQSYLRIRKDYSAYHAVNQMFFQITGWCCFTFKEIKILFVSPQTLFNLRMSWFYYQPYFFYELRLTLWLWPKCFLKE